MIRTPLRLASLVAFLFFHPAFGSEPLKAQKSQKDQRVELRRPSGSKPVDVWYHHPIKIKGGSPEFKSEINKMLNQIKKEAPLFYKVTQHRVDTIHWAANSGSFALPNHHAKGNLWIGDREWNHSMRYAIVCTALIHEIQHCNTFGDSNEGAARWAGFYYGKKIGLNPFAWKWSRAIAAQTNYKPEWWGDNILNTTLNYKVQPKHDFNTSKYSKDHAGLAAKQRGK